MTTLVIRNGHLIDPAAGVDGPKDILLKDGRVAEIAAAGKLKRPTAREILDADRPDGRSGSDRHSRSPARAGTRLQGDHRHRYCCRSGGRIYGRCCHAEYSPGE